jgi:iron complex outermembrane receptor protein
MFKISAEGANGTLQVSFVGFDEQDFSAAGNNLSIGLSRSNADLSEVVVVGYGQTVKRELTSSVAKVK